MGLGDLIRRFYRVEKRVARITPITGVYPIVVVSTPKGLSIRDARVGEQRTEFDGWVTNAGPNGEADYDDEDPRYWVKIGILEANEDPATSLSFVLNPPDTDDYGNPKGDYIFTVTNLPEMDGNTAETNPTSPQQGGLGVGQHVHIRRVFDIDGNPRLEMSEPGGPLMVPVNLTYSTGDDGTDTTAAEYEYTGTFAVGGGEFNGGDAMTVVMNRPKGDVDYAEHGTAVYIGGEWVLWWVDETPKDFICDA